MNMLKMELKTKTNHNLAYDTLRHEILYGRLLPGSWLREQDLVEKLGVSRTPIREALRHLETEGLVEIVPYRGAKVFAPDLEDVREEYTLRAALEGFAVELAIMHITDEDIEELQRLSDEAESLLDRGNIDGYLDVNHNFHMKIYSLAGSRRLVSMIEASWDKDNLYRRFYYSYPTGLETERSNHLQLLEACRLKDAELARKLMEESCLQAVALFARSSEHSRDRTGIT
jgi:DNA-binding GntR family transcriptional regulator